MRPHDGVVTDQFKLVRIYKPEAEYFELYDRKVDPAEMKNFANDPAYSKTVETLKIELARLKTELQVPAETPREAFGDQPLE